MDVPQLGSQCQGLVVVMDGGAQVITLCLRLLAGVAFACMPPFKPTAIAHLLRLHPL